MQGWTPHSVGRFFCTLHILPRGLENGIFFLFGGGLKVEVFEDFGSNVPLMVLINPCFPSKEKPKHILAKMRLN